MGNTLIVLTAAALVTIIPTGSGSVSSAMAVARSGANSGKRLTRRTKTMTDFWLGALSVTTIFLAVLVTVLLSLVAWAYKKLSKFVDMQVSKKKSDVTMSAQVRL